MKNTRLTIFITLLLITTATQAQSFWDGMVSIFTGEPTERALVRQGNEAFGQADFGQAEIDYRKSLMKNEENDLEAGVYNLGNALCEQERFEEAIEEYTRATEMLTNKVEKGNAYYNMGNALMNASKLPESIEAYKNALRNNPKDADAKYNLALAQKMKQEEQEQQQENQENQEENQENQENQEQQEGDKEQESQENQENQEQQEGDKEQENQESQEQKDQENQEQQQQQEGKESDDKESQNQQQQEGEQQNEDKKEGQDQQQGEAQQTRQLSKEEAARLLEALKDEELKVQQKLHRAKGKSQRIKIEKDW